MSLILNDSQLERLSEFMSNLGLVFFASATTPLFVDVDKVKPFILVLGVFLTVTCLVMSLFLLKGIKNAKS